MKSWLRTLLIASISAIVAGSVVALAAQTNYLGTVFIADSTTPTQQLKINSDGSINVDGGGGGSPTAVTQSGVWQVTPTLTTASVLTRPASATAYTAGELIASSATASSIVNPSFSMPTLGGAIPRLRLISSDTTSTAWANSSVQVDLWDAAPTWTNGDHGTWLPATGSSHHIASYTCTFGSAVWGDGLATECTLNQGSYASVVATTVYWSAEALNGSGTLSASAATLSVKAELN